MLLVLCQQEQAIDITRLQRRKERKPRQRTAGGAELSDAVARVHAKVADLP